MRKVWGCDQPQQAAVEVIPNDKNEGVEYYSCPLLFIPEIVLEFNRKFQAIKSGMARAPEYEDQDSWFHSAMDYYENWLIHFKKLKGNRGGF